MTVTSDRPPTRLADVYARWLQAIQRLLWLPWANSGAYFYGKFNEFNKDPEQILKSQCSPVNPAHKMDSGQELAIRKK